MFLGLIYEPDVWKSSELSDDQIQMAMVYFNKNLRTCFKNHTTK